MKNMSTNFNIMFDESKFGEHDETI